MAENTGWPPLPGLSGGPFTSQARQVATPPAPPEELPDRLKEAVQAPPVTGNAAPVPPADIPYAGVPGQKHGTQPRKQNFFDQLFGGG